MTSQEEAETQIATTSKILNSAPDYLDLQECKVLMDKATAAFDIQDFQQAFDYAIESKNTAMSIREKYLFVVSELEKLENNIAGLKQGGVEIEGSSELIDQVKNALVKNDFTTATTLIERNKMIIENFSSSGAGNQESAAKDSLEKIYQMLSTAPEYIDTSSATDLYNKSLDAYNQRNFDISIELANTAQKMVMKLREGYMKVVDKIHSAENELATAQTKGYNIDMSYIDAILEEAKQGLVSNNFNWSLEKVQEAMQELNGIKETFCGPIKQKVIAQIDEIKNYIYNLRKMEVDVSDTEPLYKKIQDTLRNATDYSDYEEALGYTDELKAELIRLKEEKEKLDELPKQISATMREIKMEVGFLKTKNIDTSFIEEKLQEAVDLFATAEEEEEYQRVINLTNKVNDQLGKLKEKVEQVNHKRDSFEPVIESAERMIEELKNNKAETQEHLVFIEKFRTQLIEANDMEELEEMEESFKDFVVSLQAAIERSREVLGLQQSAMNEVDKLKATSTELVEAGGDLTVYEERIREIINEFNGCKTEKDFTKIIGEIDELIPLINEEISTIKENNRLSGVLNADLENLENEISAIKEHTDTTEANDLIANVKELIESKDFSAAQTEVQKCQQIIYNLKDAQPVFEVKIDTEDVEPNNWAQTDLIVINNGKAHSKQIVITFEGPLEIRKLKPIANLKAGEEHIQKIGVKFTDKGEIPIDIKVNCVRTMDDSEFEFTMDYWASVGISPVQKEKPLVTIVAPEAGGSASYPSDVGEGLPPPDDIDEAVEAEVDMDSDEIFGDKDEEDEEDKDIVKRMKKLNELKQLGLIEEEEYQEKRKELLSNL